MIWAQHKCAKSCPPDLVAIWGFCVDASLVPADFQLPPQFVISRVDDLTYSVTSSTGLISSADLVDRVTVSIDTLQLGRDFQFKLIQSSSKELRLNFRFFVSFENKKLSIQLNRPVPLGKLAQSTDQPTADSLIDDSLSIVSGLSGELVIPRLNLSQLQLNSSDPAQVSPADFHVPWIRYAMMAFGIMFVCLFTLSFLVLLFANRRHLQNPKIKQLKFWLFSLIYEIFWLSCLGLVNRPIPANLDSFLSGLYLYTFGLDDLPLIISNFSPDQPQFYRFFKSNSLLRNSPVLVLVYSIVLFTLLVYSRLKLKSGTMLGQLASSLIGHPLFALLYPTILIPLVDAGLCIRGYDSSDPFSFLDLSCSLIVLGFVVAGILTSSLLALSPRTQTQKSKNECT